MVKEKHKVYNHVGNQNQPNLNIIISNSIFNNFQPHQHHNKSTNKNY